jgi:2-polyprenyl-3-methyl-5-hydroxy-6-metoxy-1,4-benzoquinol methylase
MRGGAKRSEDVPLQDVQAANQAWWTDHTMSYDWNDKIARTPLSAEWFEDADRRFIHGARLFAHDREPFDRLIPFGDLKGKRVLEIGCGMGLHSELMARSGAELTSIDLSPTSVDATTRRFALKGLRGDVRQMDAETLAFPDGTFDFVWSWGVIHHSAHTGRVIREIHRVLKPGGECRVMVYNLAGMPAYLTMMLEYSWKFWRGKSLDECLWATTDGFTARYYSRDMLSDIFSIFFEPVSVTTYGQDADAAPLPAKLRRAVLKWTREARQRELVRRRGAFLFATAIKPA